MSYFARDCCCGCEPAIRPAFVDGDDPGPGWEVVAGSAPTSGDEVRLDDPGTMVICRRQFHEPWQTLSLLIRSTEVSGKRTGCRLIFDYHAPDNFQFLECIWNDDRGGELLCDQPSPRPHVIRFGRMGPGGTTHQKESWYFGDDSWGIFWHLCIRPDGFVIQRPALDGLNPVEFNRSVAIQATVTSPRFGFGLGGDTDVECLVTACESTNFRPDDTPLEIDCPNCQVIDPALAARFHDFELPDEVLVELPGLSALPGTPLDCGCHAGTYVLPRNQFDYYAMEFPIDCDEYGFDCSGENTTSQPHHNLMRIELYPSGTGVELRVRRYGFIGVGAFPDYLWTLDDVGRDLDPHGFTWSLDPLDNPSLTGCESTEQATVSGIA